MAGFDRYILAFHGSDDPVTFSTESGGRVVGGRYFAVLIIWSQPDPMDPSRPRDCRIFHHTMRQQPLAAPILERETTETKRESKEKTESLAKK